MSKRDELIAEANDLGIEFKGNISNIKLAQKIAEFKGEPPPLDEKAPPSPAAKVDPETADESVLESAIDIKQKRMLEQFAAKRAEVARSKERAFKTRVVTLTNRDGRENEHTTTAYLCVANAHFTKAKIVPLDEPVELEQCLINNAKSIMMTIHKDEFIEGKRTGNKISARVPKYTISYAENQPDNA